MGMNYPTSRNEQAAYWHLKLAEPEVSAEEIQTALAWQADPDNRAALEKVAAFWKAWPAQLPLARDIKPARPRRFIPWGVAAAGVVAACLGTWFALFSTRTSIEIAAHEYTTAIGEVRSFVLSDGSEVTLGGATSIHVRYSAEARHVEMSPGEALFTVRPDSMRPFMVAMPNASARVIGTRFNVHRGPDEATVTVLEGMVRVEPPEWRAGNSANLPAGTQVAVSTDGQIGKVRKAESVDVASWQAGRFVFVDRTLRSVVADLNRYSRAPIVLADPGLVDTRVSGAVKLDQIDPWIEALSSVLDMNLIRDEHGITLAPAAGSQPPAEKSAGR